MREKLVQELLEIYLVWIGAGLRAAGDAKHRCFKDISYNYCFTCIKPLLNHRVCRKPFIRAEEKNDWMVTQWSRVLFLNFAFYLEIKALFLK